MHPKSALDQQLEAAQQKGTKSDNGDDTINFKADITAAKIFIPALLSLSTTMPDVLPIAALTAETASKKPERYRESLKRRNGVRSQT